MTQQPTEVPAEKTSTQVKDLAKRSDPINISGNISEGDVLLGHIPKKTYFSRTCKSENNLPDDNGAASIEELSKNDDSIFSLEETLHSYELSTNVTSKNSVVTPSKKIDSTNNGQLGTAPKGGVPESNSSPSNQKNPRSSGDIVIRDRATWKTSFSRSTTTKLSPGVSAVNFTKDEMAEVEIEHLLSKFQGIFFINIERHIRVFYENKATITAQNAEVGELVKDPNLDMKAAVLNTKEEKFAKFMGEIKRNTDTSSILFNKFSSINGPNGVDADLKKNNNYKSPTKNAANGVNGVNTNPPNDNDKCLITKVDDRCYITEENTPLEQITKDNSDCRIVKISLKAEATGNDIFKIQGYSKTAERLQRKGISSFVAQDITQIYKSTQSTQSDNKIIKVFTDNSGSNIAVLYASQIALCIDLEALKKDSPHTFNYLWKNKEVAKKYISFFTLMFRSKVFYPHAKIAHVLDKYMCPTDNSLSIETGLEILKSIAATKDETTTTTVATTTTTASSDNPLLQNDEEDVNLDNVLFE